jgi:hypothetical protein
MKINLQEELNRMKYLLNVERGKLISETEIKKTYIVEQNSPPFKIDFKNFGQFEPMATNVEYNGQRFKFSLGTMVFNALGPSKTQVIKPGEPKFDTDIPKYEIEIFGGQGFNPNFVTPNEETKKKIKEDSKRLVDEISEIYNFNKNIDDVIKFLGNGFLIEAHADGSVPLATRKNRDVVADHKKYSSAGLYGGTKDLYDRNSWLAKKRGENVYRLFINNTSNYLYETFGKNEELIDLVNSTLLPKSSGGKSDLTIVNHLNKDGSANPSEIGVEFRKIVFTPRFDVSPIKKQIGLTEPKVEDKIDPGTFQGIIDIPVMRGTTDDTIIGLQLKDEAFAGSLWWGISETEYEKNKEIIPWISDSEFNNKSAVTGKIENNVLSIENISFGEMGSNKADKTKPYSSSGRICINGAGGKIRTYQGEKYYEVRYFGGVLSV